MVGCANSNSCDWESNCKSTLPPAPAPAPSPSPGPGNPGPSPAPSPSPNPPITVPAKGGYCSGNPVRMGYVTAWSRYRTGACAFDVAKINKSKWTHLLYSFGTITGATVSLTPDDIAYVKELKATGIKLVLSVGGWGYAGLFPPIASSAANQKLFSDSILELCRVHGFEGVDVDWEYPVSYKDGSGKVIPGSEGEMLGRWLVQLRAALGPNRILSMAVPPTGAIDNYPLSVMATQLDYLNVMTYDFHGPWDSTTGANTPNNEIFPAMDRIVSMGFPKEKLVLGLAFYGRTFKLVNPGACTRGYGCGFLKSGGAVGPCSQTAGILFPGEIDGLSPSASLKTDSTTGTTWFISNGRHNGPMAELNRANGDLVTYDSAEDIRRKDGIARGKCFGGTMVWAIDQDPSGRWAVW
ncbi:hypothetical protein HDU67_000621 [Dinochytrium kinnereticum]|nr:hypothetical protein HDU67_000621 [Dinochytrium kinnereticum]